ncbi:hypothetical protein SASPL_101268 [Salvia splendens]|uniref:AB hydrolase-1 domain-containing protein n=1 Tax=Salvia splendens TaxID=180675 RepID=A0A8X8YPR6_SALSN|nr:hypothetical protein SASPL_101268 [Salvia splendens]
MELVEKLGVHVVVFDKPGYGESDPDPKSIALDIAELGDELGFGPKFYVVGCSMGGQLVWGCLKYIPHRLAGAALLAPVINYRWPSFPPKLAKALFRQELPEDQWAVIAGRANFSAPDLEILSKLDPSSIDMEYPTQQGVYESLHRDMIVAFGAWEFDPMEINDPFPMAKDQSICGRATKTAMSWKIIVVLLMGFIAWAYRALRRAHQPLGCVARRAGHMS